MEKKEKITSVEILGNKYNIKSEESAETVKMVAKYVEEKMKEIINKNNTLSFATVATLAAMNIANDYFNLQKKNKEVIKEVESIDKLIKIIDSNTLKI